MRRQLVGSEQECWSTTFIDAADRIRLLSVGKSVSTYGGETDLGRVSRAAFFLPRRANGCNGLEMESMAFPLHARALIQSDPRAR